MPPRFPEPLPHQNINMPPRFPESLPHRSGAYQNINMPSRFPEPLPHRSGAYHNINMPPRFPEPLPHRSGAYQNINMPPRFPKPLPQLPLAPPPCPCSQCIPPLTPPLYARPYARPGFGPCFPSYGPPPPLPPSPDPYRLHIMPRVNFSTNPNQQLRLEIMRQIEYYFSFENLIKDTYLRKRMDQQGWVPVRLIAAFPKIGELTHNIQIILDSLRSSTVFEILGDKIRLRVDWERWVMPEGYQLP